MNKTEYMETLKKKLSKLPREDYEKAIEYFEEYFAEAGPEQEKRAMEDLGSPEFASEEIIREIAINNTKEPIRDVKKGLNAVWVGILAIFAAPIALPLAGAGILIVVSMLVAVFMVIISFAMVGVVMIISVPVYLLGAALSLSSGFPVVISCIGIAFLFAGAGMAITYGSILLCRRFLTWVVKCFGYILNRGEKRDEK